MSMADKPGMIWFDGKLIPWAEAKVHVLTHGLHYGTGVFEGIRAYSTKQGPAIFRLEDHIRRLFMSMKILNMQINYSYETILAAVISVVRENKLHAAYIRPICFYNDAQLGLSVKNVGTNVAIAAWEWGAYLGQGSIENGISVHVSSFTRHHVNSAMCKAKVTGHYVNSTLAQQQAAAGGYQEAILLDSQGFVAEGSGENIFMYSKGKLHTPMLSSCLDGVTRDTVITFANEIGMPVVERNITRDELYIADEVFFTGTAAEITPICQIDNRMVSTGRPGPITQELQKLFYACVHNENKKHRAWLTFVNQ